MVPKKIRLLSLIIGLLCAAVAGSIALAFDLNYWAIAGISVVVGFLGAFWGSGLVTDAEVLAATNCEEYLNSKQTTLVVCAYRGLGEIEELQQASIFWVERSLEKLERQGLLEYMRISTGEGVTYAYRRRQTVPQTYQMRIIPPTPTAPFV